MKKIKLFTIAYGKDVQLLPGEHIVTEKLAKELLDGKCCEILGDAKTSEIEETLAAQKQKETTAQRRKK